MNFRYCYKIVLGFLSIFEIRKYNCVFNVNPSRSWHSAMLPSDGKCLRNPSDMNLIPIYMQISQPTISYPFKLPDHSLNDYHVNGKSSSEGRFCFDIEPYRSEMLRISRAELINGDASFY